MIETPRLLLRSFKKEDLADFYAYCKIEGIGEAAGWPHHQNIKESSQILERFIATPEEYALVLKSENKVIGSLGVHQANYPLDEKEIGYVLSKEYWSKGLMSEAVTAMSAYLFSHTSIKTIWVSHQVGNTRSQRVIEKSGFVFEKEGLREMKLLKETHHSYYYCLTRTAYYKKK